MPDEFIDAQARMSNDGAKGASVKLVVVRHYQLRKGLIPSKDHVAAFPPFEVEADLFKRLEAVPPRSPR